jgi:hypothetical protein
MGNYHHHQNPSAFNLDRSVISTVCNLYAADGLYTIDSTVHSPLIGFSYDGFPVYGAYAYKNADGTGGIVRMKSSFAKRIISTRTTYADGSTVTPGPTVSATYPLGYFKEDYEYIPTSAGTPDYLDQHNGRYCITPEYPAGMYCYFATVDDNWNSAYPYLIGPTYYGTKTASKVTNISESVTQYTAVLNNISAASAKALNVVIYPNPASDLVAVQLNDLSKQDIQVELYDMMGKFVQSTTIYQGSTIAYFDTRILYNGDYVVRIHDGADIISKKISVLK